MTLTLKALIGAVITLIAVFAIVGGTQASEEPQTVHIQLTDSQVHMSQFVVTAGRPVKFEVANEGSIAHHLVIRPMSAPLVTAGNEPVVGAHTTRTIEQKLAPGIYRISCDLFDHAARGMESAIAAETVSHTAFPIPINGLISLLVFVLGCVYIIGDSLGIRLTRSGDR